MMMRFRRRFAPAVLLALVLMAGVALAAAPQATQTIQAHESLWSDPARYPARGLDVGITRGEDGYAMFEGHYVNGIHDAVMGGDFFQGFGDENNNRFIPEDSVWLKAVYGGEMGDKLTGFETLTEAEFETQVALARGESAEELARRKEMELFYEQFGLADGQYGEKGHVIGVLDTTGDYLSLSLNVEGDPYMRGQDQMGNDYLYLIAEYDGDTMTGFKSVEPEEFDEAYKAFMETRKKTN